MNYDELNEDKLRETMKGFFSEQEPVTRRVTLHTGPGGMDLMGEAFEGQIGLRRIYLGRKVIRILRKAFEVRRSQYTDRYYRLVKI